MKHFILGLLVTLTLPLATRAGDAIQGDLLVKTIKSGETAPVSYLNPLGKQAQTTVFCLPSEAVAKTDLNISGSAQSGGMILLPGSTLVFKTGTSRSSKTDKSLKNSYVQVRCS
jgi:hypothetical protein